MLIDKEYSDIISCLREVLECLLNSRGLGLGVDDKKVFVGIWRLGNVLDASLISLSNV